MIFVQDAVADAIALYSVTLQAALTEGVASAGVEAFDVDAQNDAIDRRQMTRFTIADITALRYTWGTSRCWRRKCARKQPRE